nr:Pol polyprotein [Tanacetum cinerariifolium]
PFPKWHKFEYILFAVDYVSKCAKAQALPTNNARVVVTFLRKLFCHFGMSKALISDQGIKRRRRDLYGDDVRNLATTSRRGRLKEDLESSTWRWRQDFKDLSSHGRILLLVSVGNKCSKVFPLLVIEFGDSNKAPPEETAKDKGPPGEVSSSTKKKGRTVAITAKDMQKRKNDVKARTTLLLALPDEHQLRFSKYDSTKELWEAILKTFETLEQTFNRLQAIVSHLEFMDVSIEQDDLNQKFLTSLAPECLVYTIVILLESANHQEVKTEGRERESYKKDPKVKEPAPKAMIAIDGIGVIWPRKMKLQRIMLLCLMKKKPTPIIDVSKSVTKEQEKRWKSNHPSFFEERGSSGNVVPKPMIKFVKESGYPNATKVNNTENARKPTVKYAEIFDHLEFNCNHDTWVDKGKTQTRVNHAQDNMKYTSTHKSMTPRAVLLKSGTKPIKRPFSTARPTLKSAQPKMKSFVKITHSNVKRPFERKLTAKNKVWSPTVRPKIPTVGSKVPTAKPSVVADKGNKGKAVKASARWI